MRRRLESGCATTGKDSASAPSGERLLHDEATALLLASAVAAWAILRRHDPGGGPAAAGYSLGVRRGMTRLARCPLAWIVLGGIPQPSRHREFEWANAVGSWQATSTRREARRRVCLRRGRRVALARPVARHEQCAWCAGAKFAPRRSGDSPCRKLCGPRSSRKGQESADQKAFRSANGANGAPVGLRPQGRGGTSRRADSSSKNTPISDSLHYVGRPS